MAINIPEYVDIKVNGFITTIDNLKNTPMYKINLKWIETLKSEGYTIIDIGNPFKQEESLFYNLEKQIMGW